MSFGGNIPTVNLTLKQVLIWINFKVALGGINMLLELAMAGYLQCNIVKREVVGPDLKCWYTCIDGTKDFAKTLKQYRCPDKLYVDRPPLTWKQRKKLK